jgi:hypothetical protein
MKEYRGGVSHKKLKEDKNYENRSKVWMDVTRNMPTVFIALSVPYA